MPPLAVEASKFEAPRFDADLVFLIGILFVLLGVVGGGIKLWKLETPRLRAAWQFVAAFFVGLVCIAASIGWKLLDKPEEFKVISQPRLAVDPPFTGEACPARIQFTARIRTSKAGTVKYAWVRPDGEASRVRSIVISDDGTDVVTTSLTFGVADSNPVDSPREYRGSVFLRIYSPTEILSTPGPYRVICD